MKESKEGEVRIIDNSFKSFSLKEEKEKERVRVEGSW